MADKKILIIEDDPKSLNLICDILKHEKYEISSAADGYQALAVTLEKRPDLIILDINLPCGGGLLVHERIMRNPSLCAISVMYVTADPSPQVRAVGQRLGAVAVLGKPIDRSQLLQAVSSAFQGYTARPIAAIA